MARMFEFKMGCGFPNRCLCVGRCQMADAAEEWASVSAAYGRKWAGTMCPYCGITMRIDCRDYHATRDHITAISRGGSNSPDNVIPACWLCTQGKGDRHLDEWRDALMARGEVWHAVRVEAFMRSINWKQPARIAQACESEAPDGLGGPGAPQGGSDRDAHGRASYEDLGG